MLAPHESNVILGQRHMNTYGWVPRTSPSWGIISRDPEQQESVILHGMKGRTPNRWMISVRKTSQESGERACWNTRNEALRQHST